MIRGCLKSLLIILLISEPAWAKLQQHLVLFGGGPRPREALSQFLRFAGGTSAKILVVTWASDIPDEVLSGISNDLRTAGATHIISALKPPANADDKNYFLAELRTSDGVFFSGGDQNKAMRVFADRELREAVLAKYREGAAFAGTSAGTAMMSDHMMTGNSTPLGQGLGLLPHVILDTHFLKRRRNERLAKAVLKFPELLGVGIDEGATLVIEDGIHARVFGPQQVVMTEAHQSSSCETYLQPQECYNLIAKMRERCRSIF